MHRECLQAIAVCCLFVVFTVSRVSGDPLRIDFASDSNAGGGPNGLQDGFVAFLGDNDTPVTHSFLNNELAGVGNSVSVTVAVLPDRLDTTSWFTPAYSMPEYSAPSVSGGFPPIP